MLYKLDQFPQGAISPVSFLWRQIIKTDATTITENMQHREKDELIQHTVDSDNVTYSHSLEANNEMHIKANKCQLWIWCHPASFSSVFEAISEACRSVGRTSVEKERCFPVAPDKDETPVQETQRCNFVNDFEHPELRVMSRQYDLLRLRLTGPESHALLTNTLEISCSTSQKHFENKSDKNSQYNSTFIKDKGDHKGSSKWQQHVLNNPSNSTAQSSLWEKLKKASSTSALPSGCIIGLTVHDPRLYLPGKKKNIMHSTEDIDFDDLDYCDESTSAPSELMSKVDTTMSKQSSFEHLVTNWPTDVASSHIWEEAVRQEVKETKISEQDLNQKRSLLLVPGSQLDLRPDEISHIPLLLIQQPGSPGDCRDGAGYRSGWDIILPSGWAMAFWMAFVYRGARTGGLRESQTLALEQGMPFFPNDFPDTPAGEAYYEKLKEDGEAQYGRYPPAKRPNYDKLGIKSPFCPPWKELVEDWSLSEADPGGKAVESTETTDSNNKCNTTNVESSSKDVSLCRSVHVLRSRSKLAALRNFVLRCKAKQTKGIDFKHSVKTTKLPLPMNNDLSAILKDDANSLVCVLVRMVGRNVPVPNSTLAIPSEEDVTGLTKCKNTSGPVEPLHKGALARTSEKSLRNFCTREIMGFVSSGQFSLARGCGFGVGFCALPGLAKLLSSTSNKGEVVVLVRSPTTQQYRFAHLTIM
ncbi:Ribonucleases P/MRP protein subunit POP1 [Stylophora pistillata]|uniref:Ribonucleases P/MRP protein subunit POP1 n=2 Tax=Stylophora pistillata TaxID=50429 RepID=A0A2B4SH55_STYPI|nr:Ribonucleases P/MRP protein subunit POP1 [Stylophora pistillata]